MNPPATPRPPYSHPDRIPPGSDPSWPRAPTHKAQKYNQPSAGSAQGIEREEQTVGRERDAQNRRRPPCRSWDQVQYEYIEKPIWNDHRGGMSSVRDTEFFRLPLRKYVK